MMYVYVQPESNQLATQHFWYKPMYILFSQAALPLSNYVQDCKCCAPVCTGLCAWNSIIYAVKEMT